MLPDIFQLIKKLDGLDYVVEEELATILLLMLKLKKPLLLEGPPGVGKTEASQIIDSYLNTKLIRLQCYDCLLYTSPSPRDGLLSRMPSSA